MDVVERLTNDEAHGSTVLACEHRHRYEFAAGLCAGRRVLDLCCGGGYGSAILAGQARSVVGVDRDVTTIHTASLTLGRHVPRVRFECADALAYLRRDIAAEFDVVVCFEGLEHLENLDQALGLLREHARAGLQLIASVPNGRLFGESNPFHVTQFGYDEAVAALEGFPEPAMLPQFLAEGSLICPPGAEAAEVAVVLDDRDELPYANHFILTSGVDAVALHRAHHGSMQITASPVYNRWTEGLRHGMWALEIENARLARRQVKAERAPDAPLTHATRGHRTPYVPLAPGADAVVPWFNADDPWQMSFGERTAILGLLQGLRPQTALEIGTAQGGGLRRLAEHCEHVYGLDVEPPPSAVTSLPNVSFYVGPSEVTLEPLLASVDARGGAVDFALVDGDHSAEGVRRDVTSLLDSPAVRQAVIVVHDAYNPGVRAGLDEIQFDGWDKVIHVELDWVPGHTYRGTLDGERWGGLALVVVDATSPRDPSRSAMQEIYLASGQA